MKTVSGKFEKIYSTDKCCSIELSPLSERTEDIPDLIKYFRKDFRTTAFQVEIDTKRSTSMVAET